MQFWQIVLGFVGAFILMNTWTRIKWRFGIFPLLHDVKQAHITAKNAAQAMFEHMKQSGRVFNGDPSPEEAESVVAEMYCFARQTIIMYTRQLELPTFDSSPDPKGIHQSRVACSEVK